MLPAGSAQVVAGVGSSGVLARLSSDIPLGPATLIMNLAGQISAPAQIAIVPSSFGVFTRAGARLVLAENSLTKPARPGDVVTIWGTGLGSATRDRVSVLLGGHSFPASYAGPAPGLPGTDQINFQVPDDATIPYGCYAALAVQVQDYTSNLSTLSTTRNGGACVNPLGYSAAQMARLDAGESVYLGQVNLYQTLGRPPGSQWFDATGFTRLESADASFRSLDAISAAALTEPLQADDAGPTCSVTRTAGATWISAPGNLSAGAQLALSGNGKSLDLPLRDPQSPNFYFAQLPPPPPVDSPDAVPPPFFRAGEWQVSAPGGAGIGSFTGQLSVPPPVRISNAADLAAIDPTHDLTVRWNGGDYPDAYTATLQFSASSTIVCRAPASAGQITIPAALLRGVSPGSEGTGIELLLATKPDRATILKLPLAGSETLPVLLRYYPSEALPVTIATPTSLAGSAPAQKRPGAVRASGKQKRH